MLTTLPGVDDAVVVGVRGPQGQHVHAALLSSTPAPDLEALVRQANTVLASHQRITGWTIWSEPDFPRTHTLKVKRQEVLARLEDRTVPPLSHPRSASPTEASASPVRRLIMAEVGAGAGTPAAHDTLADLGLDSLARVELLAAIEGELGIYLDETAVDATTSVAELEAMVDGGQSSERPVFSDWPLGRVARAVRAALQPPAFVLLRRFAPVTVAGSDHVSNLAGPVLLVANHASHLDSAVLLSALPRRRRRRVAVAAAADYFFARPLLGSAIALLLNAFPFSRTTAVRPTLEHCAALLDRRWSILLYPEGTRSLSGAIGRFKPGVGLLAVELEVPVVPVYLEGLRHVLPKGQHLPRRGPASVTFGPAMTFEGSTPYEDVALRLEQAVAALQPTSAALPLSTGA